MFKSLFGQKPLYFDPALGDSLAKNILSEAEQGRVDTLLASDHLLRNGEWDRRTFYVDLAGKYLQPADKASNLPDTPLGNLIRGSAAIHAAWRSRGSGLADTVTNSGWQEFFRQLDLAGSSLTRAAQQDQDDPTALALLQTVATGLQLDRAIAGRWLAEALRRDPYHQQAHYRHLMLLCQKWGGSHEEMYRFARATVDRAPVGSTLPAISYVAFQEHYLYVRSIDRDPVATEAILHDRAVREESARVYDSSLRQRRRIERVSDYFPHNVAAWWFHILQDHAVVRQETRKIGPYFTEQPWSIFYRDPAAAYQRVAKL